MVSEEKKKKIQKSVKNKAHKIWHIISCSILFKLDYASRKRAHFSYKPSLACLDVKNISIILLFKKIYSLVNFLRFSHHLYIKLSLFIKSKVFFMKFIKWDIAITYSWCLLFSFNFCHCRLRDTWIVEQLKCRTEHKNLIWKILILTDSLIKNSEYVFFVMKHIEK